MKSIPRSLVTAACVALSLAPLGARANVVTTFTLSGFLQYQGATTGYDLTGSVDIDTTTGTVVANNVLPSFGLHTISQGYNATAQAYSLVSGDTLGFYELDLFFNTASLVGYTGGDLASVGDPTPGGVISGAGSIHVPNQDLLNGQAFVPVPEPATFALLGFGALALAGAAGARRLARAPDGAAAAG